MGPDTTIPNGAFHLPIIGEALGQSPLYDEWKGDFALAAAVANTALHSADDASRPVALMATGLVHLLQGEILNAREALRQVASLATEADHQLVAFAYDHLA